MRTYCVIRCQNDLLLTSVGFMHTIDSQAPRCRYKHVISNNVSKATALLKRPRKKNTLKNKIK